MREFPSKPQGEVSDETALQALDPRSLPNLCPPVVREAILAVPEELASLDDEELAVKTAGKKFTPIDHKLRVAFWKEYARAQDRGEKMQIRNIYTGICSRENFYNNVVKDPARVAHLTREPTDYSIATAVLLNYGTDRLLELLARPAVGPDGKFDHKLAELHIKAYQQVDSRVHGGFLHRVEQKSLNVNIDGKKDAVEAKLTYEEIQKRLAELRAKEIETSPAPAPSEIVVQSITLTEDADE